MEDVVYFTIHLYNNRMEKPLAQGLNLQRRIIEMSVKFQNK